MDIVTLFQCLHPLLSTTTRCQFCCIASALLGMTGRVTMLGIARWAGSGGSYRTVQRFFHTVLPWAGLFWLFFRQQVWCPQDTYLMVGDDVVVTKAGHHTYGLDRFFSSVVGRPVPGLAFFVLGLVSVQQRRAFPLRVEQIVRAAAEPACPPEPAPPPRRRGRPQGSRTRNKAALPLPPELARRQAWVADLQRRMAGLVPVMYLLLDGQFGTPAALQMARQCSLQLISKLRHNAALYQPYAGPYAGRGPHRKYGAKLNYDRLPERYLRATRVEGDLQTQLYQAQLLHKDFAQALNVVILVQTHLRSGARAHAVLFSSDLELGYAELVDYYRLRFQIEFNFREAKQHWGLEDFMNVQPTAVTNAANLALFMVNVAHRLLSEVRLRDPACSLLDLRAAWRAQVYVRETIKFLPQKPDTILLTQILQQVASLGRIHPPPPGVSPS